MNSHYIPSQTAMTINLQKLNDIIVDCAWLPWSDMASGEIEEKAEVTRHLMIDENTDFPF